MQSKRAASGLSYYLHVYTVHLAITSVHSNVIHVTSLSKYITVHHHLATKVFYWLQYECRWS